MNTPRPGASTLAALLILVGMALPADRAHAHVTLENTQARAGTGYKAVLRVPHGCKGSATVRLSVQIPAGVIAVKPQPKPGWQIEITHGPYAQAYTFHGARLAEGVRTLTWSGGRLPDEYYDEFAFSSQIASSLPAGTTLYFPVVQTCEQGVQRWIETSTDGQGARPEMPAPSMQVRAGEKR